MPVQINEIVIRATVETNSAQQSDRQPQPSREEIVSECVEQVLEILKNQQER